MRTLAIAITALGLAGCSPPARQSPPAAVTETAPAPDIASADPQVQYFHEQLVANGEDLQSEFGTYLSTLGMNPRDLQQDDPTHAYDVVLEKVRTVGDATLRGQMMRAFFNR